MADKTYLLTDDQVRRFIVNGYVTVNADLPASFHDFIYKQTEIVFEKEGNPGNNLLPKIPEIQAVFDDKWVIGGLTSVLGEDYYTQPHRHSHFNQPKSEGQRMHQDSGKEWSHHTRRLLVFYYPQDTPIELGPTAIAPGSHYYNTPDGATVSDEFPVCGKAGTVAIVNYDLWHRAMPNRTDKNRYMMNSSLPACRSRNPLHGIAKRLSGIKASRLVMVGIKRCSSTFGIGIMGRRLGICQVTVNRWNLYQN